MATLESSDITYPLFPICAFIGFTLVLTPLPWHLQAWNAGTCLYMVWTAVACFNLGINAIIWHGNALNPAPVWCDISSRLIIASNVGIPAASLCINRRLYKIATSPSVSITRAQKRRAVIEDLAIGLGIPLMEVALHYIVNGHRFNIIGDVGCFPVTINVWLAYPLVALWPITIGLISAVFCILSLRAFYRRHAQFVQLLSNNSALTMNRYFRLMALATTELLCTVPIAAYTIFLNVTTTPMVPYKGWADLHFGYSRVDQIPATIWRLNHKTVISIELDRWLVVICAFVFFIFFGFADEARRHYRVALRAIGRWLHISSSGQLNAFGLGSKRRDMLKVSKNNGVIPVFVARPPPHPSAFRRDSLVSVITHADGEQTTCTISSSQFEDKNHSMLLSPTTSTLCDNVEEKNGPRPDEYFGRVF